MKFRNFSDEDFKWKWDGVEYTFLAGEETFLEDFKFFHFGKHLVDRELLKAGLPLNAPKREEFERRCIASDTKVAPREGLDRNEKSKARKRKVKKEEEFPELKKKRKK